LDAIAALSKAGIPVGVLIAPVILALNDFESPAILSEAKRAAAKWAGMVVLRLPLTRATILQQWLDEHAPEKKPRCWIAFEQ
jgi:DNA repair photolyase